MGKEKNFLKELRKRQKLMKKILKPKIDFDEEYDIFYLWFGRDREVDSTIEVDNDMRFDVTKDGLIISVEIEGLLNKLKKLQKKVVRK